jgi:hypothetical protein
LSRTAHLGPICKRPHMYNMASYKIKNTKTPKKQKHKKTYGFL